MKEDGTSLCRPPLKLKQLEAMYGKGYTIARDKGYRLAHPLGCYAQGIAWCLDPDALRAPRPLKTGAAARQAHRRQGTRGLGSHFVAATTVVHNEEESTENSCQESEVASYEPTQTPALYNCQSPLSQMQDLFQDDNHDFAHEEFWFNLTPTEEGTISMQKVVSATRRSELVAITNDNSTK